MYVIYLNPLPFMRDLMCSSGMVVKEDGEMAWSLSLVLRTRSELEIHVVPSLDPRRSALCCGICSS